MNSKAHQTQPDLAGTNSNHVASTPKTTARTNTVEGFYIANYSALLALAFDTEPALLHSEGDEILAKLSQELPTFKGRLTDNAFSHWAGRFVKTTARNMIASKRIIAEDILRTHRKVIHFTVEEVGSKSTDCAVTNDDIEAEIHMLVFRMALKLSEPGTAKVAGRPPAQLPRRLKALVVRHCLDRIKKDNNRLRIYTESKPFIGAHGCETVSDADWASYCADEMEAEAA